ncbi:MAG: hypothetical protein ACT4P2_14485 [Pseudomonadota bacterium]
MSEIEAKADAARREELVANLREERLAAQFEKRYGRGWQRRLAEVINVPVTTVNGWFRNRKFDSLAKLAFAVILQSTPRQTGKWVAVKMDNTFSVVDISGPVGRMVAENIPSIEYARLIAAAPALWEACGEAWVIFVDKSGDDDVMREIWGAPANNMARALNLVEPDVHEFVRQAEADEFVWQAEAYEAYEADEK